jgi:cytochrome c-type biogenesis protein CcmH/NrfF
MTLGLVLVLALVLDLIHKGERERETEMTNMEMLAEKVRGLGEDEKCPVCKGESLIPCPDHMSVTDEDGWCMVCDSPDLDPVSCPCQGE